MADKEKAKGKSRYALNKDGGMSRMMCNSALLCVHCVTAEELMVGFDTSRLRLREGRGNRWSRPCRTAVRIAATLTRLIVDDIVERNAEFRWEGRVRMGSGFGIGLEPVEGERYAQMRRLGQADDFDPLLSGFRAWMVTVRFTGRNGDQKCRRCHVDTAHRAALAARSNAGRVMAGPVRTLADYNEALCGMYPDWMPGGVRAAARHFVRKFFDAVSDMCDVRVWSKKDGVLLHVGLSTRREDVMRDEILRAMRLRIRWLYREMGVIWDSVAYFAIDRTLYEEKRRWIEGGQDVSYGKLRVFRTYDEAVVEAYETGVEVVMGARGVRLYDRFMRTVRLKADFAWEEDRVDPDDLRGLRPGRRKYRLIGSKTNGGRPLRRERARNMRELESRGLHAMMPRNLLWQRRGKVWSGPEVVQESGRRRRAPRGAEFYEYRDRLRAEWAKDNQKDTIADKKEE